MIASAGKEAHWRLFPCTTACSRKDLASCFLNRQIGCPVRPKPKALVLSEERSSSNIQHSKMTNSDNSRILEFDRCLHRIVKGFLRSTVSVGFWAAGHRNLSKPASPCAFNQVVLHLNSNNTTRMSLYTCVYVCVCIYIYTCTYVCVYIYIRIHIMLILAVVSMTTETDMLSYLKYCHCCISGSERALARFLIVI